MSAFTRLPHKAAGKLRVADRLLAPNRGEPVVLMYHGVVDDGVPQDDEGAKHVRLSHFRDQLRLLERCRRVVPLTTLVERLLAREDCRGLVAITFDDGYLNNAEWAALALREFSMSASFFVATGLLDTRRWAWTDRLQYIVETARDDDGLATGFLGGLSGRISLGPRAKRGPLLQRLKQELKSLHWREAENRVAEWAADLGLQDVEPWGRYRFMSWDDARSLAREGFEIGAHTINHAALSRIPVEEAEEEILGSRAKIREEVGRCCATFCYPYGKPADLSREVVDICAGNFEAGLSAIPGFARLEDRFVMRRIGVDGGTSTQRLAARLLEGL